jgi:hypothetical protein
LAPGAGSGDGLSDTGGPHVKCVCICRMPAAILLRLLLLLLASVAAAG